MSRGLPKLPNLWRLDFSIGLREQTEATVCGHRVVKAIMCFARANTCFRACCTEACYF